MTQQEFHELSKRYLEGKTSEEEEEPILAWFDAQSEFKKTTPPGEQSLKASKRVWSKIRKEIKGSAKGKWIQMGWVLGMAASLLLVYMWLVKPELSQVSKIQSKPKTAVAYRGIELKNTTYSDQKITLVDGSIVALKPGSGVVLHKNFNRARREVYLTGEAFFKVSKNPAKPFIVHAGKLIAEVIGTSFTIKNVKDSKNVVVDVLTGKVSVYARKAAQAKSTSAQERMGVVLTPNQRVQYLNTEHRLVKSIVEVPNVIITQEELQKLTFVNAPIAKVFMAIEKAYGLDIIYDEEVMQDCIMTTSLDEENLHDQLTIISKLLNASYKMVDAQIVVTSNGCQ